MLQVVIKEDIENSSLLPFPNHSVNMHEALVMCCGFTIKANTFFIYELRLSISSEQVRMPTLVMPQRKFKHLLQPRVSYSNIQLVSYCTICRKFYFYYLV